MLEEISKFLCGVVVGFFVGAWLANDHHQMKKIELENANLEKISQINALNAEKLSVAISEKEAVQKRLDDSLKRISDLSARVRQYASDSGLSKDSDRMDGNEIGRCKRLVDRSASLLDRCARLSSGLSANAEAVHSIIKNDLGR